MRLLNFKKILFGFSIMGMFLLPFSVLFSIRGFQPASNSCTIFTVSKNDKVFFGNNEDYPLKHGRIWFLPPFMEKYGLTLFGYEVHNNLDIPVGGMNDQGLVIDMNSVPSYNIKSEPEKKDYMGSFIQHMLEECATIPEVLNWIENYNLIILETNQVHIADKTGDAIVIGLDENGEVSITRKTGDFLVSTNFNLAQEKRECRRYQTATNMLRMVNDISADYCRQILKETAISSLIMYSTIHDLKNGVIYLYAHGDFERGAVISLNEELSKGLHSYDISTLISQQTGSLENGARTSILFSSIIIGSTLLGSFLIIALKIRKSLI